MTQTPAGEPRRDDSDVAPSRAAAGQSPNSGRNSTQPNSGPNSSRPRRSVFARARSALRPNNRRLLAEMIRYGLVSVIALVVDYATLVICWKVFGWHYLTAASAAFALGIIANYICSRIWVFDKSKHHRWIEMAIFLAVGVTGLGLNWIIMKTAVEQFNAPVLVGKLISTALVFFWNFLLRRFLIYTGVDGDRDGGEAPANQSAGTPDGPGTDNFPSQVSPNEPNTQYGSSSHSGDSPSENDETWPARNSATDFKNLQEGTND